MSQLSQDLLKEIIGEDSYLRILSESEIEVGLAIKMSLVVDFVFVCNTINDADHYLSPERVVGNFPLRKCLYFSRFLW